MENHANAVKIQTVGAPFPTKSHNFIVCTFHVNRCYIYIFCIKQGAYSIYKNYKNTFFCS